MEKLGDAKFYADYHRVCGSIAQKSLMAWLRDRSPELAEQVKALVEKEARKKRD